ncbi:hypothetical protein V6N13_084219 [Hibiscus sabdariffa]
MLIQFFLAPLNTRSLASPLPSKVLVGARKARTSTSDIVFSDNVIGYCTLEHLQGSQRSRVNYNSFTLMASSGTADKTLPLTQTENRHIKNTIPNDDALDSVNP